MAPSTPLPFDPISVAQDTWVQRWGSDAPADEMAAATSVLRVAQLLTARFDAAVAPHGLTFARYEVLVLLTFSRTGALPMSKIGERLMVHPTSATSAVQRLEAQGFVRRVPNPADGRGTLAEITSAGREVVEAATAALHALDFGLSALDPDQVRTLTGLMRQVRLANGDFAP